MDIAASCFQLLILIAVCFFQGVSTRRLCNTTQYLSLGTAGTINCEFDEGFYSVIWYNTTDYVNSYPVMQLQNSMKSGIGYELDDFDVFLNGSLVLRNVTIHHDGIFTAAYIHNKGDAPVIQRIRVIVVVEPRIAFPYISICGNFSNACYSLVNLPVLCSVQAVRPQVSLNWIARTAQGDKYLAQQTQIVADSVGYTTHVATHHVFPQSSLLEVLVCKASDPAGLLFTDESKVLAQNGEVDLSLHDKTFIYVERGRDITLICSNNTLRYVVWKRTLHSSMQKGPDMLLYSVFFERNFSVVSANNTSLGKNGSLIILSMDVNNSGYYYCIYGEEPQDGVTVYNVQVYVTPIPSYPIVEGCIQQHFCVVNAPREGTLKCEVLGIYPPVELKWKTLHDRDSVFVNFTDQQLTAKQKGEKYDLTLTSKYIADPSRLVKVTVECRSTAVLPEPFILSRKMDLFFTKEHEHSANSRRHLYGVILPVIAVLSLAVILARKIFIYNHRNVEAYVNDNVEADVMLETPLSNGDSTADLKNQFLTQLKRKYEDLFNAVQPVPHDKSQTYCVHDVFVEVSMKTKRAGERTLLEPKSYDDLLKYAIDHSKRYILEGDPGCGKSIITLKLAYDWCNSGLNTQLKDIGILILLRLRQIKKIDSIYCAIRQLLLPQESSLCEDDIKCILRQSTSVAIIFDGFDEYPDKNAVTDVNKIIAGEMFKEWLVITTTRSSCLPKIFHASTYTIKLAGFDETARSGYIYKVVADKNEEHAKKIKRYLNENPVLSDVCEVPLLFVLFAHLAYENERFRKLTSVTSLFRYILWCLESHMRNKRTGQNVIEQEALENKHYKLDRLAFEALNGEIEKTFWLKQEISKDVGVNLYNRYIALGILVEEEVLTIIDNPELRPTFKCETHVRFYHKIFCDWFAASFLADHLEHNPNIALKQLIRHLDPVSSQYVYRFACGISTNCAKRMIEYLKTLEGGDEFAVLCILEQTGNIDENKHTIRQLCFEGVIISGHDSLLLQRSSVQLVEVAARNNIPVEYIDLHNCFHSVDFNISGIRIRKDLVLSATVPIKVLAVTLTNREMTYGEAVDIMKFSSLCPSLQNIWFGGSVLPESFKKESILESLKSRAITVFWRLFDESPVYILDMDSGRWKNIEDNSAPTEKEFENMRELRVNTFSKITEDDYKRTVARSRVSLRKFAEGRTMANLA